MSINASIQQIAGGIASWVAGLIVIQSKEGPLLHYDILGYAVIGTMCITVIMMYFLNNYVKHKTSKSFSPPTVKEEVTIVAD